MKELELKLIVPPAWQAALLRSLEMAKAPKVELEAHYFDTADRLLDNSGMSLRVRKEGKAWVQTLKSSTKHPASRLEHNVVVAATDDTPRPDLVKHAGSKAGRALQKLLGDVSRIELHEVFRTTVTRHHLTRQLKADAVEFAFDKGLIRAHGRELAVSELELELMPAQDALGKHNDGLVALEAFKGSTQRDGRAWFGVGWLTAHQAQTASHCKQRLQQLGKAKPFW